MPEDMETSSNLKRSRDSDDNPPQEEKKPCKESQPQPPSHAQPQHQSLAQLQPQSKHQLPTQQPLSSTSLLPHLLKKLPSPQFL